MPLYSIHRKWRCVHSCYTVTDLFLIPSRRRHLRLSFSFSSVHYDADVTKPVDFLDAFKEHLGRGFCTFVIFWRGALRFFKILTTKWYIIKTLPRQWNGVLYAKLLVDIYLHLDCVATWAVGLAAAVEVVSSVRLKLMVALCCRCFSSCAVRL